MDARNGHEIWQARRDIKGCEGSKPAHLKSCSHLAHVSLAYINLYVHNAKRVLTNKGYQVELICCYTLEGLFTSQKIWN